jgi:hypothetical protein
MHRIDQPRAFYLHTFVWKGTIRTHGMMLAHKIAHPDYPSASHVAYIEGVSLTVRTDIPPYEVVADDNGKNRNRSHQDGNWEKSIHYHYQHLVLVRGTQNW